MCRADLKKRYYFLVFFKKKQKTYESSISNKRGKWHPNGFHETSDNATTESESIGTVEQ